MKPPPGPVYDNRGNVVGQGNSANLGAWPPKESRTPQQIWDAFVTADAAWTSELEAAFARGAGDARYTERGHGKPGTPLRALYESYMVERVAWFKVSEQDRAGVVHRTKLGSRG